MFWQLVAIGFPDGCIYALVALGMWLTYGTRRFFDFSHAAVFTFAAYATYAARQSGIPFSTACFSGIMAGVATALLFEFAVFKPMRRHRHRGGLEAFLASLGLVVAAEAILSLLYGREPVILKISSTEKVVDLLGVRLTPTQLSTVGGASLLLGIWWIAERFSPHALFVRAVADDEELAALRGVPVGVVTRFSVFAAAVAISSAGVLRGADLGLTPSMGFDVLLVAVVAMIVGEPRGLWGVIFAAIALGVVQQLALLMVSARWQSAIVFLALLVFVLLDRSTRRDPLHDGGG